MMSWSSFFKESEFIPFTAFHFWPIFIIFLFGVLFSYLANKIDQEHKKSILGAVLGMIPFSSMILSFFLNVYEDFNYQEDLPFHLCRFLSLIAPFIMYYRNRFWLGIFYFWIIVGTLNANITPDVEFGYPHWTYFNYFFQHTGLLILPVYAIWVYKLDIVWRDFWNAYIGVNVYMIFTLIVNFSIGSNYMYTHHKPPVETLLNILGPWPWYMITGQVLALGLCFVAIVPFLLYNKYRIYLA